MWKGEEEGDNDKVGNIRQRKSKAVWYVCLFLLFIYIWLISVIRGVKVTSVIIMSV